MQRYTPQVIVPGIGSIGQKKIANARILIVGAGGLGTPLAMYLSAAGVGSLGIADGDKVDLSNLSRQFMYTEQEVGQSKAKLLAAKLLVQNPGTQVNAYAEMLSDTNVDDHISQFHIVCDCTDNMQAKILLDRACEKWQKPLVYAAVKEWEGYVSVLHHTQKISLERIFSEKSMIESDTLNCSLSGIVNAVCGIAGSIQASETLKIVLGMPSQLDGSILVFDVRGPVFRTFLLQ